MYFLIANAIIFKQVPIYCPWYKLNWLKIKLKCWLYTICILFHLLS